MQDNSPDLIFEQDQNLKYVYVVNLPVGLAGKEMLGRADSNLFSSEIAATLSAAKNTVLFTGQPQAIEVELTRPRVKPELYNCVFTPRVEPDNRVTGLFGYCRKLGT